MVPIQLALSFDDEAEPGVNKLADQWQEPYQEVAAMVSGAKKMALDGDLAKDLASTGFPQASLPNWFGSKWRADAEKSQAGS